MPNDSDPRAAATPLVGGPARAAGPLRRGAAYLLDATLAFGLVAVAQLVVFAPLREALGIEPEWFRVGWRTELYTLVTISLPVWTLFALGDSVWPTPGRRLLRVRVEDARDGRRLGFGRAFCRAVVKLLPWEIAHLANNLPTPMWYADDPGLRVGFFVSGATLAAWGAVTLLRRDRRGPHDLVAGSRVVRLGA